MVPSASVPYLRTYHVLANKLPSSIVKANWGVYYDDKYERVVVYFKAPDGSMGELYETVEKFPSDKLVASLILVLS